MNENAVKLLVFENAKELGNLVKASLEQALDGKKVDCIEVKNERFSNGEGKVMIDDSIRFQDVYILTDVGNYSMNYKMHGNCHYMSPDEHFQDLLRVISAMSGCAGRVTVIMPLLYQSRQHKRKGKESLDCALALQELEAMGVDHIISIDVHDPNVSNAIPKLPFDNFYPTHEILKQLVKENPEALDNLLVVSPDMGAMERARYYAEMLGCDVGVFYKRRDLSKAVNGKNPIVEHAYMGASVKGKDILVVDDMIASGTSMIEVATHLKQNGARNVFLATTFALLTEGPDCFIKASNEGLFEKLYATNLFYVSSKIIHQDWYRQVDCSNMLASIIASLYKRESVIPLNNRKLEVIKEIEALKLECIA